uniref:Autophagy-related protein 101 n=1 Tax=Oryza glumipatula TaxID=40148 RepID=A0A0E0BS79_9ORYZ
MAVSCCSVGPTCGSGTHLSVLQLRLLRFSYPDFGERGGDRSRASAAAAEELEQDEIKDVLRCILHTIFFHRTLTLVRPKDVDCDLFEITYVQCGLPDLEKEVDEKINQFIAWVEKHPNRRSQVCLSFFDEKNKNPSWFTSKTERIYWEQWFINLHVISPKGHGKSRSSKASTSIRGKALEEASSKRAALGLLIQEVLFQIINFANEKKDHIPPISDRIFNHEISIPSSSDSVFGWNADVLRRVLNS